jgi:hypothetical protein
LGSLTLDPAGDANDFVIIDAMQKDYIEVAVATDAGLFFVKVYINADYKLTQSKPVVRKNEKIKCVAYVREDILLYAPQGSTDLYVYDKAKNEDILKVLNVSIKGNYISMLPVEIDPALGIKWHLFAVKDNDKMELVVVDIDERRTEEISLG